MTRAAHLITAPASSGNLGPGFDVFAVALALRNELRVDVDGNGRIEVTGEGSDTLATDETNLVARAFAIAAGESIKAAGVDLRCTNRIPLARGLGSSTAAAACGLIAGWQHVEHAWSDDELFAALCEIDGHPDNAAACAYGGVVLCHDRPDTLASTAHIDVVPLGTADWLRFVALVPNEPVSTQDARRALPESYSRGQVVRAIGGASMLAAGLVGGHVDLLADALDTDVIHEPFRAALTPQLAETRAALTGSRALGATLSGAGPTVLVWCTPDGVDQVEATLAIEDPEAQLLVLEVAASGAHVD